MSIVSYLRNLKLSEWLKERGQGTRPMDRISQTTYIEVADTCFESDNRVYRHGVMRGTKKRPVLERCGLKVGSTSSGLQRVGEEVEAAEESFRIRQFLCG